MKTRFTIYSKLGSYINTDSLKFAKNRFEKCYESTYVFDNIEKKTILERSHEMIGEIQTGIRHMGRIVIFECSDNKLKITNLGNLLDDEINRISRFEKNRKKTTTYVKYDENNKELYMNYY